MIHYVDLTFIFLCDKVARYARNCFWVVRSEFFVILDWTERIGEAVLMLIAVVLSLLLAFAFVVAGFFLLATKKPVVAAGEDSNMQDEVKSIWQYLGLVDNTPNLFWAVVAGDEEKGPIVGYMANVEGMRCDWATGLLTPLAVGENPYAGESEIEKFIRVTFGKRVFGWPIIRSIRPVYIERTVRSGVSTDVATLSGQLESSVVKRYGLRVEIFRPTLHTDVDTSDGKRFTVISYAIVDVVDPRPAFTVYKRGLLETVSEKIASFFSVKVLGMTWEDYKLQGTADAKFNASELDATLFPLGVKVRQLTVSDPELNAAIQAAIDKRATAVEEKATRVIASEGDREARINVATGEAQAIEKIAVAKRKRVEELVTLYKANGVDQVEAVKMANIQVAAEFTAEAISKLTGTYVAGNAGVQIGVHNGQGGVQP